ncbi:MAG TPA: class III poly(R)-hydroxyalkanoic acid synthase subunit PhaC [Dehalococcoidia bacterium]|nr:class III poly(R)-hydroxyalkanoic acid synthase subunit PhaC [Dehalococcoidia bacterium]
MAVADPQAEAAERFRAELEQLWQQTQKWNELSFRGTPPRLGQTPRELVYQRNKMRVYRYIGQAEKRYPIPLLMIYALINKPYILDLYPGNSLIEHLLEQGFDIFLIDWGEPGPEDKRLKLDDYVLEYIPRAVRKVQKITGAPQVSLLGYCMGGTIVSTYAALHPDAPIRNLVLMVSPIDFDDAGLYTLWLSEPYFNTDKFVNVIGNVPPEIIDFGNKMQKPVNNYWSNYVGLFEKILEPQRVLDWQALNKWVNDGPYFPAEWFRQWITEFYQNNRLIKGELIVRGQRVDLSNITCPLLSIAADRDHIVPPHQAEPIIDAIASEDKEFLVLPGGHVSLIMGRGAQRTVWPKVSAWLGERSR